jgi:hypothetical protein
VNAAAWPPQTCQASWPEPPAPDSVLRRLARQPVGRTAGRRQQGPTADSGRPASGRQALGAAGQVGCTHADTGAAAGQHLQQPGRVVPDVNDGQLRANRASAGCSGAPAQAAWAGCIVAGGDTVRERRPGRGQCPPASGRSAPLGVQGVPHDRRGAAVMSSVGPTARSVLSVIVSLGPDRPQSTTSAFQAFRPRLLSPAGPQYAPRPWTWMLARASLGTSWACSPARAPAGNADMPRTNAGEEVGACRQPSGIGSTCTPTS